MNLKRLPFTVLMVVLLTGFGIWGQSHVGELNPSIRSGAGFSTQLLLDGHLHRTITSVFFTAGGWQFYSSLLMCAAAVGSAEWNNGTRQTVLTFAAIHVATLLILSLGVTLPLVALETVRGDLLFTARDVGPSAGYYGCLGLAVAGLNPRAFRMAITFIGLVLFVRFGWSAFHLPGQGRMLSADLTHLIAFPLGAMSARLSGTPELLTDCFAGNK